MDRFLGPVQCVVLMTDELDWRIVCYQDYCDLEKTYFYMSAKESSVPIQC